jgi:hypothetical protein
LPIFTLDFPCVTLTKRSNLVWDSEGAVWTPHDAHVGCEKYLVKQKWLNSNLKKMTPWGLCICSVTLTKRSVYFKIIFSTVKQLPVTQIGGEKPLKIWVILCINQVLSPDPSKRSETNRTRKQPYYLHMLLISGPKVAPVRRTWKINKK